jgi:hypothetical protein
VSGAEGKSHEVRFLVDTGADQSAFSAALLQELQIPANSAEPGHIIKGIGGATGFVVVTTVMELTCADGTPARIRGQFSALTDPAATDLSILGRDVLNNFDVITSRRRNEVLLVGGNHQYRVT